MKTPNAKGLLTKVFDGNRKLLSTHKSMIKACKEYKVKYKSLKDHKYRHPEEKEYKVWLIKYTKIKYIITWGDV